MALGSFVYFTTTSGGLPTAMWKTDGSAPNTTLVKAVGMYTTPAVANGAIYFASGDSTNGIELWKSDGTPTGTALLANLRTGVADSTPHLFMPFNGRRGLHGHRQQRQHGLVEKQRHRPRHDRDRIHRIGVRSRLGHDSGGRQSHFLPRD
jgi:ELWxxDGT repeat protein